VVGDNGQRVPKVSTGFMIRSATGKETLQIHKMQQWDEHAVPVSVPEQVERA